MSKRSICFMIGCLSCIVWAPSLAYEVINFPGFQENEEIQRKHFNGKIVKKYPEEMSFRTKRDEKIVEPVDEEVNNFENDEFYDTLQNEYSRYSAGGEEVLRTITEDNETDSSGLLSGIKNLFHHSSRPESILTTTRKVENISTLRSEFHRGNLEETNKTQAIVTNVVTPRENIVPAALKQDKINSPIAKNEKMKKNIVHHASFDFDIETVPEVDTES